MADVKNPLLGGQREKKGSETKADYSYQYHWALYRAIKEHSKQNEYAVFIELHEDVVLCNSLDASIAQFEFNQIKTTAARYTKQNLTKLKNGKSPLGKLISSAAGKSFANQLSEMNFVSVSGFNIVLKDPEIQLNKITIEDIDDTELSDFTLAIKNELGLSDLPANLQFIIPDISDKSYQNEVIAEISKLISELFPGSNYNPLDIYRILIDELNRKGEVTYDFNRWNDLLKNKALTCTTVTSVINAYTNIKNQPQIEAAFSKILDEIGLSFIKGKELKRSFDRYQQAKVGSKTVAQLDTAKAIQFQIALTLDSGIIDMSEVLSDVYGNLNGTVRQRFPSETDAKAAIICELILGDYE